MNMEKTYKIIGKTNPYIAQRDVLFKHKTEITLAKGMTLKQAQDLLLRFYNEDYETSFSNWGNAVRHGNASKTAKDGTRQYEYDSRYYRIEEETQEEWQGIN